jgi:CBS domain-containing protein
MRVSSLIADKPVVTIGAEASLEELLALLRSRNVGAVVVSSDGQSVDGIVSERDIVRAMPGRLNDLASMGVRDLMTADVITCTPDTLVSDLMATMTERRIRHVPVVDEIGDLVSIVSIGDVVKVHISELDQERAALRSYISS